MWITQELKISAVAEHQVDISTDFDWPITSFFPSPETKNKDHKNYCGETGFDPPTQALVYN
jgi:hypothetical protein